MKRNITSSSLLYITRRWRKRTTHTASGSLREEHAYEKIIEGKPPEKEKVEQAICISSNLEKESIPSAKVIENSSRILATPQKLPRLQKAEAGKMPKKNLLLQAYTQEVCFWTRIVYGNPHILQKQIQEILEDPTQGKVILQKIATSPRSVHRLAGKKVLGIKSCARRKAEKSVEFLCIALDDYTRAVKNAAYFPYTAPTHHEQPIEREKQKQSLQKEPHSKERAAYSDEKIAHQTPQKPRRTWKKNSVWMPSCLR